MAQNKIKKVVTARDYPVTLKVSTITAVIAVLFSTLFALGVAYEKIWSNLRHLDGKTDLYQTQFDGLERRVDISEQTKIDRDEVEALKERVNAQDIVLVELRTRLASIDLGIATLQKAIDKLN